MNGPEHYRKAETLLAEADSADTDDNLLKALIHATLAQAAATALRGEDYGDNATREWRGACVSSDRMD